jgi:hypothetical protein
MEYGEMLSYLKEGRRAARVGWKIKDVWLILVPEQILTSIEPNSFYDNCGFLVGTKIPPRIEMKTIEGNTCVGYTDFTEDQLATDWYILIDID